jgi:L-Ala-D/L-Glu epimerase
MTNGHATSRITWQITPESWELREPFEIARGTLTALPVLLVQLTDAQDRHGWAEAAGVDYAGETPESMTAQIERAASELFSEVAGGVVTPELFASLQAILPPGGARNALDCALWDLCAKQTGTRAWQRAALPPMRPVTTVYTIGLGSEDDTRRRARAARGYPQIKIKCDAERHVDVVRWIREEHPTARLAVDANQSWTRDLLDRVLPRLQALGVELVEQPVRAHEDAQLDGLLSAIPLAADESVTDRASLAEIVGRYQYVNIKLDKCGGLTEAMALGDEALARGLRLMVGNMCGSSLGMAPAFLVGQRCDYVDLDGPLLQVGDRAHAMSCVDGVLAPPSPALWG